MTAAKPSGTQQQQQPLKLPDPVPAWPVGDTTSSAWREQARARIYALRTIARWARRNTELGHAEADEMLEDIAGHLETADKTAGGKASFWRGLNGSDVERTLAHVEAAEVGILRLAPSCYVSGEMPTLRASVREHLPRTDAAHAELEKLDKAAKLTPQDQIRVVSIVDRANVKGREEITRVRSFRNLLLAATVLLLVAAVAVAIFGALAPDRLSMCFNPESRVVCPTGEARAPSAQGAIIDPVFDTTASPWDLLVVEIVGLLAAAVAAALTVSGIRGTSTPYSLPVAQAVVKLPLGAITAVLGLLLMRGEFVPGLTALDTPAQIVAWAAVFGYAQQLFTRLVDRQAQSVLDEVGGAAEKQPAPAGTSSP